MSFVILKLAGILKKTDLGIELLYICKAVICDVHGAIRHIHGVYSVPRCSIIRIYVSSAAIVSGYVRIKYIK